MPSSLVTAVTPKPHNVTQVLLNLKKKKRKGKKKAGIQGI